MYLVNGTNIWTYTLKIESSSYFTKEIEDSLYVTLRLFFSLSFKVSESFLILWQKTCWNCLKYLCSLKYHYYIITQVRIQSSFLFIFRVKMKIYWCFYHIETSQLNWIANQLTGFYMMATLVLNFHISPEHGKELEKNFSAFSQLVYQQVKVHLHGWNMVSYFHFLKQF